jgi:hypothetical protein
MMVVRERSMTSGVRITVGGAGGGEGGGGEGGGDGGGGDGGGDGGGGDGDGGGGEGARQVETVTPVSVDAWEQTVPPPTQTLGQFCAELECTWLLMNETVPEETKTPPPDDVDHPE